MIAFGLILGVPLALVPASPLSGIPDSELVARAHEAFEEGVRLREDQARARPHFDQAATLFEELRNRGAHNPVLYRNLGNAWLLAGDLPRAILNYHRGLQLAPHDGELHDSLEAARLLVAIPQGSSFGRPPHDERPAWLRIPPRRISILATFLCYVSGCLLLARWFMKRNFRLLWVSGLLFLATATGVYLVVAQRRDEDFERNHPVVVIAGENEVLRRGNGHSYPPRYPATLAQGVEARLLHERDGWFLIELTEGETGWIPCASAMVVETRKAGDSLF